MGSVGAPCPGPRFGMNITKHLSYLGYVLPSLSRGKAAEPFDWPMGGGLSARCYMQWPAAQDNSSADVIDAWDALAETAPRMTAFQSPAWQGALAQPFVRANRYRLVTLNEGAHLAGVIPLQVNRGGSLETPGEMISDYLDPLIETADPAAGWSALLALLRSLPGGGAKEVILPNARADAPCRPTLAAVCKTEGYELSDEPSGTASRIALPKTWDDYLARLAGHDRKELRRKMRNAQTKAAGRLKVYESDDLALPQELDRVFDFMKSAGGAKGIKATWMYRPLFKRALPGLIAGRRLRLYSLILDDQPAAGLICFPATQGPMMWAGGWNPEFSKLSPGIVLFGMAIQHAIEQGAATFDLLRGQSRYKSELGAQDVPIHRLTLRRKAA
jgi:CelD/BcsL family acetyltransferase involved in cellulose biosynthesis